MGREITDLLLAVNRSYGKADYLPCIVWGGLARQAARWEAGDRVRLRGRLQSRNYIKVQNQEAVEKVAFEVSVMAVERVKREEFEQREWDKNTQNFVCFPCEMRRKKKRLKKRKMAQSRNEVGERKICKCCFWKDGKRKRKVKNLTKKLKRRLCLQEALKKTPTAKMDLNGNGKTGEIPAGEQKNG